MGVVRLFGKGKGVSRACNSHTGCIATEMLQVTKNRFQCAIRAHAMTRGELMN